MIRILTLVLAVTSTPVLATEWFVSPNGSDTAPCTLAAPCRTLLHVFDESNGVVQAGDTVTLRGGTYSNDKARIRVPNVTLQSYPGETAHIAAPMNDDFNTLVQIDPEASGATIRNLELSGGLYYAIMLQTAWYQGGGEDETGPSNILIEGVNIHDSGRDGIKVTPMCHDIIIRNNEIARTGAIYPPGTPQDDRNADGIDIVNGQNILIEDNYIHDTSTTGLYFKGGSMDVTVERNRLENLGSHGISVGFDTGVEWFNLAINPDWYEAIRGVVKNNYIENAKYAGISLYSSKDSVVANNTIIDSAWAGQAAIYFGVAFQDWDPIAARPPNVNPTIRNNIVIQTTPDEFCVGIRYADELGGLSALAGSPNTDYNLFWNTSGPCRFFDNRLDSPENLHEDNGFNGDVLAGWQAHEGTDSHSIQADVEVDDTGHIADGSAAMDAGTVLPQVVDDIDGQARYAPYDIGADEISGPPPNEIFINGFD